LSSIKDDWGRPEFKSAPGSPHRTSWAVIRLGLSDELVSPIDAISRRVTRIKNYYASSNAVNDLAEEASGEEARQLQAALELVGWLQCGSGSGYLHNTITGLSYAIPVDRWVGEEEQLALLLISGCAENIILNLDLAKDVPAANLMRGIFLLDSQVRQWVGTAPSRNCGEPKRPMDEDRLRAWVETLPDHEKRLPFRELRDLARAELDEFHIPDKMTLRVQKALGYARSRGRPAKK